VIAYVDSSVVLRLVLGQPGALAEWRSVEEGVTSALTEVECLRTLDRLRIVEGIPDQALAERRESIYQLLSTLAVMEIGRTVLDSGRRNRWPTALRNAGRDSPRHRADLARDD